MHKNVVTERLLCTVRKSKYNYILFALLLICKNAVFLAAQPEFSAVFGSHFELFISQIGFLSRVSAVTAARAAFDLCFKVVPLREAAVTITET